MQHNPTKEALIEGWNTEQLSLHKQQLDWQYFQHPGDLTHNRFYMKTLSGLVVCNELVLCNAQLKDLNRNKIHKLRHRINEFSARVEAFRELLNGYCDSTD